MQADERTTLTAFLEYFRSTLLDKAADLTDAEARRASCPPSDLSITGLIRHMAEVERHWFRMVPWADEQGATPLFYGNAHPTGDPDGDLHPGEDDTLGAAIEAWLVESRSHGRRGQRALSLLWQRRRPVTVAQSR